MTRTLAVTAVLMLAGCATAERIPLPDGSMGYVIEDCDNLAECYKKAAEVCGGKYQLVDRTDSSAGSISGGIGALIPQYTLTIKCGTTTEGG